MLNVNSKILWLADYNLNEAPGGAQRSDQMIIDQGRLMGFNILKHTNATLDPHIDIHKYDVVISSNIHALSVNHKNLINEISRHKYHVRLEHDSNEYLKQEDRAKLFGSCKKTIFLTQFHHYFFTKFYGDIFKNVEIIYDPIDSSKFKNLNQEREDKILFAGYMHPLKGAYEFFEYVITNPDKQFVFAGWCSNHVLNFLSRSVPNIEYLGLVDHSNMPEVYNKYKYMFYSPNLNEPFCRSVAEASLCGMQILTNAQDRIGCLLEIKNNGIEKFRQDCSKAALKFWETI